MGFFLQDGNQLFTGALVLMLMIAVLEGVMMLIGVGISDMLDNLLPDMDVELDAPETEAGGVLTKLLGWLRFGEVPALILLVAFLVSFGVTGLSIQMLSESMLGFLLPGWLIAIPVLALALPQVRFVGNVLRRFAVGDETEAVGRNTFIGRVAVITIGEARAGSPAEARFSDEFGTTHYVMVEPDTGEIFSQGEQVLLVEERGAHFRVIRPHNEHLLAKN
ncbi:YqiJ family protein [Microbulbifer salipaludis]|uniref:YqiJ family protein n=1 Tax=Microbulbifer salipaludis TaxID=187980 RepID=A0ABS3E2E3_9GAMM|nr:YqiJ family protein [Microbulbifer salipaludis]MBN8429445.1 YqiJ family protein [Microbulbifer salipaludis]